MRNAILTNFEERMNKSRKIHPSFRPGDTVRVHFKIEEGSSKSGKKKYRIQAFEGVCIRYKKGTAASSFTVRKIGANSIGVERIFSLQSQLIDHIDLVSGGCVRRARLYYLRDLKGKAARISSRRLPANTLMTTQDPDKKEVPKKKKKKN